MALRTFFICFTILLLLPVHFVVAQTASSPNYKNVDSSILPLIVNAQSGHYQIDGAIDPIVGSAQSASYKTEGGAQSQTGVAPVTPTPTPTPSTGGGGGGGLPILVVPALDQAPTIALKDWTYKATSVIQGTRGASGAVILVNGSDTDVVYLHENSWQRLLPLGLGDNTIQAQARVGDRVSALVFGTVHRRLVGDVNDDRVVNDVDLSLFTRHWKTFDKRSDFNEDGKIDDIDLSLLASHWARTY